MRVALDTNVVFAAFATRGLCADLLQVVLAEHQLVLGETVLTEVQRTLTQKAAPTRPPRGGDCQLSA